MSTTPMSAEVKRYIDLAVRRAARAAVKETLLTLGIDASTPAAVREAQQDNAWLRRTRSLANLQVTRWVIGGIAAVCSAGGAVAAMAINKVIGGP
jgi:hypothetical protein